jgi:DNA polymerase-3 subunit delta'
MYREALLMIYGQENLVSLPEQEHQFIRDFCKVLKAENIDRICDLLNTAVYHLERNANVKLLFLDLSLQVHNLLRKR